MKKILIVLGALAIVAGGIIVYVNNNDENDAEKLPIIQLSNSNTIQEAIPIYQHYLDSSNSNVFLISYNTKEELLELLEANGKEVPEVDGDWLLSISYDATFMKLIKVHKDDIIIEEDLSLRLENMIYLDINKEISSDDDAVYILQYQKREELEVYYGFILK